MKQKLSHKTIKKRIYKWLYRKSPVLWANWGPLSRSLANLIKPRSQPVIILSVPRSGSSWVGEILGSSLNSLYLREPITQTFIKTRESGPSFFELDPHNLPKSYELSIENSFTGIPLFPATITKKPEQWTLTKRKQRRVIIKEVNPFIVDYFINKFQPRIIYLIRHPAAVADSFNRLGWNGRQIEPRFFKKTLARYENYRENLYSFWAEHGAMQAIILTEILHRMRNYKKFHIIEYEHLCMEPISVFKKLYEFAALEWDDAVEQHILKRSQTRAPNTRYFSTQRNSLHEMQKWKHEIPPENILQLKKAYLSFNPPYYRDDW